MKQISFETQPFIDSAFGITKETTLFFKFGLPHFDTQTFSFGKTFAEIKTKYSLSQNNYVRMLPFHKIDFVFKEEDWIE